MLILVCGVLTVEDCVIFCICIRAERVRKLITEFSRGKEQIPRCFCSKPLYTCKRYFHARCFFFHTTSIKDSRLRGKI